MQLENQNKIYKSGNHMVYSCQYHVIFCPKYRRRVLINGIDTRLKQLILEKQLEYGFEQEYNKSLLIEACDTVEKVNAVDISF